MNTMSVLSPVRWESAPVRQRELFPVPVESPPPKPAPVSLFADVVFDRPLDHSFTYGVPDHLLANIGVGSRVLAPFGKGDRPIAGFCIRLTDLSPNYPFKPLIRVLDDRVLLTPELMRLTRWMADYYLCGWGQVLNAVIPAGVKDRAGTRNAVFVEALPEVVLLQPLSSLSAKQQLALDILRAGDQAIEARVLAQSAKCGIGPVLTLVEKKLARRTVRRIEAVSPSIADETNQEN